MLAPSGSDFGSGDSDIYIPLSTAQARLRPLTRTGQRAVNNIVAQAVSEEQTDAAIEQITETLRREHGIIYAADDDFQIFSQADLLETFSTITATLTAFLGSIAGISLLVVGSAL